VPKNDVEVTFAYCSLSLVCLGLVNLDLVFSGKMGNPSIFEDD
jgi:hypothetical protein